MRCEDCKHWALDDNGGPIYAEWFLQKHPDLARWGLCRHLESKMRPEWEGGEAITTAPDFGCVQFEKKETRS